MSTVAESMRRSATGFSDRPPGERYYRHPGDVVRLVVASLVALLLIGLVTHAPSTADGFTEDLADASARVARTARELLLALAQVVAIGAPLGVVVALVVRRRWRRLVTVVLGALAGATLFALVGLAVDAPTSPGAAQSSENGGCGTLFPLARPPGQHRLEWCRGGRHRRGASIAVCPLPSVPTRNAMFRRHVPRSNSGSRRPRGRSTMTTRRSPGRRA